MRASRSIMRITKKTSSSFLEAIFFPFIEQVSFGTPQVDNFGTPVPIFLLLGTLLAVVGIRYSHSSTDNTTTLKRSIVAFITNTDKGARTHIGIANHTFSVTFLTKASDCDSRLFPAHNQIRMMLSHCNEFSDQESQCNLQKLDW